MFRNSKYLHINCKTQMAINSNNLNIKFRLGILSGFIFAPNSENLSRDKTPLKS